MNKELVTGLLNDKLKAKLQERKSEVVMKVLSESIELQEDHFSDKELEKILDKFEKDMNHDGAKAVEDYISAEADGNKVKAAKAAAAIKKAMKK